MMRTIKFRAWDRQDKKMYPIRDIHHDEQNDIYYYKYTGCNLWLEDGVALDIMQFTGLQDKNNTDIYEGDILSFEDKRKVKSGIEYGAGGFSFNSGDRLCEPLGNQYPEDVEVIGNIHKNSELLKGD